MEASDSDHREGARRGYRLERADVRADESRSQQEISDHQQHLSGTAGWKRRSLVVHETRGDCQALAELGFVVVQIEGMGNPLRSKKFHDLYYGNMGDNTLPDQVAGMKQLARNIHGLTSIAWASGAIRRWLCDGQRDVSVPDFFKVGISESGNHDNREYEDDWGERYQGLLARNPDGTTNYDEQANQNLAKNLKGHFCWRTARWTTTCRRTTHCSWWMR